MMAFDQIEPIGDHRGDWQAASIAAVLANIAAARGTSSKRFRVSDFLLEFGEERDIPQASQSQTWQEQKSIAMMFAAMFNAKPEPETR